jgi:prepilin-type N-terminal cleavage/methylation domain-containing protein
MDPKCSTAGERGFTLLELLVAMTIMLIIMGGTFTAFMHAMRVNETATLKMQVNDGLRTGIDLMVRDFIQVGQGLPSGKVISIPSGLGGNPVVRPGPPGAGYNFGAGATEISAVTPGAGLGPIVNGVTTDMITILYVDSLFDPTQCVLSAAGDQMTLTNTTPIEAGDVIMFTNSLGSAMQYATRRVGLPVQTVQFAVGDPLQLNQRGAANGTVLDLQSAPGVYPATTATRIRMVTYFLDARNNTPQLIRCINAECVVDPSGRRTVAFGVENLQLSYDLVDGVTNPTNVRMDNTDLNGGGRCGASPCSPNQIRKANLFLAVRSRTQSHLTAQFFRNTLATQVSFRSLALVDRYQ